MLREIKTWGAGTRFFYRQRRRLELCLPSFDILQASDNCFIKKTRKLKRKRKLKKQGVKKHELTTLGVPKYLIILLIYFKTSAEAKKLKFPDKEGCPG